MKKAYRFILQKKLSKYLDVLFAGIGCYYDYVRNI